MAVQLAGASLATVAFAISAWNAWIDLHRYDVTWSNETLRAIPYVDGPISAMAALALSSRRRAAWLACRVLALTWPIVPLIDLGLLESSLDGGEAIIAMFVPIALGFTIAAWRLTGRGEPAVVGSDGARLSSS